ncbi:MAG TPA: hypothetical protein VM008_07570 [Phycisphaerae bacterium]|nr:hypothetical protein [Phycisphaerae bacterium]
MQKPGIEIRMLAKQIGVAAVEILRWCSAEGLGAAGSTVRTKISFGLAETIREHFATRLDGILPNDVGQEVCAV